MVKKTLKDPDLLDAFNKMMGNTDPEPDIVIPKHKRIHLQSTEIIGLLSKFVASPCSGAFTPQFPKAFNQIRSFIEESNACLNSLILEENDNVMSSEDLQAMNADPAKLNTFLMDVNKQYKSADLGEKYRKLKQCSVVQEIIMIARRLKTALTLEQKRTAAKTHNLEDKKILTDGFIMNSDGDYLTLFNFTSLDFKQMFCSDLMVDEYRKYVLLVLHLIHVRAMAVVKDVTSPDVDVDKFSEVCVGNIDNMRKLIPRCDKAFDKIVNSVGMLKENFDGYYKDFVTSQSANPNIIIENFVIDVANSNKADVQTTRQFREIIKFYHDRIASQKVTDPRLLKMIGMVSQNIDILEDKMDSDKKKKKGKETEKSGEKSGEKGDEKSGGKGDGEGDEKGDEKEIEKEDEGLLKLDNDWIPASALRRPSSKKGKKGPRIQRGSKNTPKKNK